MLYQTAAQKKQAEIVQEIGRRRRAWEAFQEAAKAALEAVQQYALERGVAAGWMPDKVEIITPIRLAIAAGGVIHVLRVDRHELDSLYEELPDLPVDYIDLFLNAAVEQLTRELHMHIHKRGDTDA